MPEEWRSHLNYSGRLKSRT